MVSPFITAAISVFPAIPGYYLYKKSGFHLSYIKRCVNPIAFEVSPHIDTYKLNAIMSGIKRKHWCFIITAFALVYLLFGAFSWPWLSFVGGYIVSFWTYKLIFCPSEENCISLCETFKLVAHPGKEDIVCETILSLAKHSASEEIERSIGRRWIWSFVALVAWFILCVILHS